MKNAIIDFESYYDDTVSVVKQGTPNYVASTEAYAVSVLVDNEVSCGTIEEMAPMLDQLADDPTVRPVAANSNFDQAWHEKYITPFQHPWHCILDHAAFHQLPRNLAGLAGQLLGQRVDKTKRDEMKGVHYEDLPAAEKEAVQQYCSNDSVKENECFEAMGPMSGLEEKVAALTRLQGRRGVAINMDLVEADKTKLEAMRFAAFKAIPWHADMKPLSHRALSDFCVSKGIAVPKSLAKTDEECSDMMTDSPELAGIIGHMRRFRRANTMLAKIVSLMTRVTPEGILPLELLYCAAPHTRRWSSKGFNVQNLDKEPLDLGTGETVWTRNWLVPRPGKIFYIADYSQVEPRVLNWLCGNEQMMAALREGFSIYEAFARAAEGWKGEPGTIKTELGKKKYTLLKNRVLGLGYGMGAPKFCDYVRTNGGEISLEDSKKIVAQFRNQNKPITDLWKRLDNLIISACREKEHCLVLDMPSGDQLRHFHIRAAKGGYESFTTKGDFGHQSLQPRLWGGTLTENVTQRTARDILAAAMVNLEAAGFPVIFSVHDEVILELDNTAHKEEDAKEAERIMTTPPDWCKDLPLAVEGSFADAYTK